ncbi:substrate-binding domain-containing protein [Streptomyces sp. INA 01156]
MEHALHAEGRAVLFADCDDDPETEAARIADLLDRQVDALLVIPVDETHSREAVAMAAARVPLVLLDRCCGPGVADSVATDNTAGMALVLDHLAATGRRRRTSWVRPEPPRRRSSGSRRTRRSRRLDPEAPTAPNSATSRWSGAGRGGPDPALPAGRRRLRQRPHRGRRAAAAATTRRGRPW